MLENKIKSKKEKNWERKMKHSEINTFIKKIFYINTILDVINI